MRQVEEKFLRENFRVPPNVFRPRSSFFLHSNFKNVVLGKLTCKIDKVRGVIEANQEDKRNALYKEIIQEGDLLLNRLQKLSKVTDM